MPDHPKRLVRRALRAERLAVAARRDLDADGRSLADTVLGLVAEQGLSDGATVTLYEALPQEPPTAATVAALQRTGLRVLVPITLADLDLDWADAADPARTPLGKQAIEEADLVLIPGLAVDPSGTRLGQGGGCYDKALPRRAADRPVIVLLHPEEFPAGELPREPHDIPVHGVLTAAGLTWLTPNARGGPLAGRNEPV